MTIPQYAVETALNGHNSKIIVTDFAFGANSLLYSTAEVLSTALLDGVSTIAFWVPNGESGEVAFKGATNGTVLNGSGVTFHPGNSSLVLAFDSAQGLTTVHLNNGKIRVLIMDRSTAYKFWAPSLGVDPAAPEDQSGKIE